MAPALRRRDRRFRDHIGNAKRAADTRAEMIRRLVKQVIREPELRTIGVPAARDEPIREARSDRAQSRLTCGISGRVEAAKARCQRNLVPGQPKRGHQMARDFAIAGRNRMIGRLQWRVKADLHARAASLLLDNAFVTLRYTKRIAARGDRRLGRARTSSSSVHNPRHQVCVEVPGRGSSARAHRRARRSHSAAPAIR